jgi:hypothetical protein
MQYQRFDYDDRFLLEPFTDKEQFLQFLDFKPPPGRVPDVSPRKMESFLLLANKVAKYINVQREHYLFQYLAFLQTYG